MYSLKYQNPRLLVLVRLFSNDELYVAESNLND